MKEITKNQIEIMEHTAHRAANGLYCGDSPDMQALVSAGYMKSAGRVPWCPDEYFRLTQDGEVFLLKREKRVR